MICTTLQNKTYHEILEILPNLEMAEIRLDSCPLTDSQIEDLFGQTDIPLVATCRFGPAAGSERSDRVVQGDPSPCPPGVQGDNFGPAAGSERSDRRVQGDPSPCPQGVQGDNFGPAAGWAEAERRLSLAVQAGARFADLEIEAPAAVSRRFQKLCRECGTELIRSYHNYIDTPDEKGLQMALARCFRYGADIAKIVPTCHNEDDVRRIESLYSVILEDVDSMQGRLIAFGMGAAGKESRIECLRRGAPFTYAALSEQEAAAPGQPVASKLSGQIYKGVKMFRKKGLRMPASKSFAQRAILCAALAEGTSRLFDYSGCDDSQAAIDLARFLGATVEQDGSTLIITGIGPITEPLRKQEVFVGESGLLARLTVPVLAAVNGEPFRVEGRGTLLRRPMNEAAAIMASFGVLLSDIHVPLTVKGTLIPGTADISGSGGSQLISGLLMALPLCERDSIVHVSDPKSLPYMYITLDVLRHFGISTRSEMEGDARLLEEEDWGACTGITFRVRGGQKYRAAQFGLESDWSAAASFLVAGAIFGCAELEGMDMKSIQADIEIIDILVEAGALVSQLDDGTVCASRAPLEGFSIDLNHAPDLFPIVSVLAAFCSGRSVIGGMGRLAGKESNRAAAILEMLTQMGVEAFADGDSLVIDGESWTGRLLGGRLLRGGSYTSHHDHRMAMALQVASLGADAPIVIDDRECVSKSFPEFFGAFGD